jgi:ubiquinone/menaquinone biosynthesis C-methylase UbiE
MMNKNEENSIRKYDSIAADYDTSFDGKFTAKFKQAMLEMCHVTDGDKVLDVGCGNGSLIYGIGQKAEIKAFGVDISPNMIEICKRQYRNISFQTSNGEKLPFDDSNFDLLTICCVLHHLNNPQIFFIEAHRVLVKDGILLVGEPLFPFFIRKIVDWIVSPIINAGDNKVFSHERLKRLFADNGFVITEIYKNGTMQIIKVIKI